MTEAAFDVPAPAGGGEDIVAKPSRSYRTKWCVMGLVMLAYGWWSLYDGFVNWEQENQQAKQQALEQGKPEPEKLPHNELGIRLNRLIGITLQPLGLFTVFWAFFSSRGQYRLSGTTLHVPGHRPVPLENIRKIDKSSWDRKGIAYLSYEVPDSVAAGTDRVKLDDYIYQREPTDEILERIEQAVAPRELGPAPDDQNDRS